MNSIEKVVQFLELNYMNTQSSEERGTDIRNEPNLEDDKFDKAIRIFIIILFVVIFFLLIVFGG